MTKPAASEQSQMTAAATSSGEPIRPTGSSAITFARPSGRAAGERIESRGREVSELQTGISHDYLMFCIGMSVLMLRPPP